VFWARLILYKSFLTFSQKLYKSKRAV